MVFCCSADAVVFCRSGCPLSPLDWPGHAVHLDLPHSAVKQRVHDSLLQQLFVMLVCAYNCSASGITSITN
jgi:hypothetical protein